MDSSKILIQKDLPQPPQRVQISTPIGSIDTGDDNPILDGLVVVLVFFAFCFFVYAKFMKKPRCRCGAQ